MNVRTSIRLATLVPLVCAGTLLTACGSSGGGGSATGGGGSQPASGSGTPGAGSQPGSGTASSNAKCSDLTSAAASAAVGKSVTVTLDTSGASLAGLSICDVTVGNLIDPIQLAVDTSGAAALYSADKESYSGVALGGIGDQAFTCSIGVEALSGGVDVKVTGPATQVLRGDDTIPTALVKAMVATL